MELVILLVAAIAISAVFGDLRSSCCANSATNEGTGTISGEGSDSGADGTTSNGAPFTRSAGNTN
jgi:hypothetical protein